MELVWNNPNPNRTVYRPALWEVLSRNGTPRLISAHEIQGFAKRKLDSTAKEAFNDLQGLFFCF